MILYCNKCADDEDARLWKVQSGGFIRVKKDRIESCLSFNKSIDLYIDMFLLNP